MKLLVFWYCDSFCDCQMLHLAGSHDPAKTYRGIFWRVIMFGCYNGKLAGPAEKNFGKPKLDSFKRFFSMLYFPYFLVYIK